MYRTVCIFLIGMLVFVTIGYKFGRPMAYAISIASIIALAFILPEEGKKK